MPFQYEWKTTRGGRRYVRTFVPDEPVKVVHSGREAVEGNAEGSSLEREPATKAEAAAQEVVPSVNDQFDAAEMVAEAPKRGRGRPRKVVSDD